MPIIDGLNPSRVRVDAEAPAADVIERLIATQQHQDPTDDRAAVLARFRAGSVRLDDGTELQPHDPVPAGQFIWFYRRPAPERRVPGDLTELHQDRHVLVVDKPSFMSTLPRGQHITETAVVRARRQFGIDALSPAHRLDRLTRGVLLFTKSQEVRGAYQRLFESRQVTKGYEAVTPPPDGWVEALGRVREGATGTTGIPVPAGALSAGSPAALLEPPTPEDPWILRHHMVKLRGRMATYLADGIPNAETRVTGLRLVAGDGDVGESAKSGPPRVVWSLEPHSGRTHQLRVNMRLFGTPIIGDPLYGALSDRALWDVDSPMPFVPSVEDEDFSTPMGLTAVRMSFRDPFSRAVVTFRSSYGAEVP